MRQSLDGTLYEGTPPARAVPTGLPTDRGVIVALVLVVNQGVPNEVVHDFVTRYGLVFREETARAADSQARWSLERDRRVTIQLLSEQSAARIVIPSAPASTSGRPWPGPEWRRQLVTRLDIPETAEGTAREMTEQQLAVVYPHDLGLPWTASSPTTPPSPAPARARRHRSPGSSARHLGR